MADVNVVCYIAYITFARRTLSDKECKDKIAQRVVLILSVETGTQCVVTRTSTFKIFNNFLNRISSHVSHINIAIQCKSRNEITPFSLRH